MAIWVEIRGVITPNAEEKNILVKFKRAVYTEKKIYFLHPERMVKHFLNPLTRNIEFQDIRRR